MGVRLCEACRRALVAEMRARAMREARERAGASCP